MNRRKFLNAAALAAVAVPTLAVAAKPDTYADRLKENRPTGYAKLRIDGNHGNLYYLPVYR